MSDAKRRSRDVPPHVHHWVYDAVPGQIKGYDGEGRELLAIQADPHFAERLVAAFSKVFVSRKPADTGSAVPTQF